MAGRPKKRAERGPPWTMEGDWKRNDHPLAYPNSVDALFYPDSSIPLLPSHALLTLIPQDGGHLARFQRYEDEPRGSYQWGVPYLLFFPDSSLRDAKAYAEEWARTLPPAGPRLASSS
jgi:hypothetical protein